MAAHYRLPGVVALVLVGIVTLGVAPAFAQEQTSGESDTQTLERQGRLAAISTDPTAVQAEILARWAGATQDGGAELLAALSRLSPDNLLAAQDAQTMEQLNAALFGAPFLLGDTNSDLVFFPVTPCRIIDTRLVGGPIAANTARSFNASNVLGFADQGGSATTCGLPGSDAAALALTIVAVGPAGPGDLRVFPKDAPLPNASAVNYGLPGAGLNLANTTIVPLKQDGGDPLEFTIRADVSAVDVVADVVGFFWSPNATPLGTTVVTTRLTSIANGADYTATATCPVGFSVTGGGLNNSIVSGFNNFEIYESGPQANGWRCRGRNSIGATLIFLDCKAVCARVPGR